VATEVTVVLDERDVMWLAGRLDAEIGSITEQQLLLLGQPNIGADRSSQADYQILNRRASRLARVSNALFGSVGHL
jgi:hypothetical protein